MALKKKLTIRVVEETTPSVQDVVVWDSETTGFGLKVTPKGKKTFFLQYRTLEHVPRKPKIGDYPTLKPEAAREIARDLLTEVRKGNDPSRARQAKRAARHEGTIDQFFAEYLSFKRKEGRKSVRQIEQVFSHNVLPSWGKRKVDDITHREVTRLLDGIADRSVSVAAGTRRQLSAFYNWVLPRLSDDASNPVVRAGFTPAVKARESLLSDAELKMLWKVLEDEKEPWRTGLRLLALTGQRVNEVLLADWKEFDLSRKLWTIPSERAKNGKEHLVPLAPAAMRLLKALPTRSGRLFPNGLGPRSRAAKRIRKAMGDHPWRWHDLRRTITTGMQKLGVQQPVTEAILNHVSGMQAGLASVYHKHQWAEEKRDALHKWAKHVEQLVGKERKTAARPRATV